MDLNHTRLPIPPYLRTSHWAIASMLTYYSIIRPRCQGDFSKIIEKVRIKLQGPASWENSKDRLFNTRLP